LFDHNERKTVECKIAGELVEILLTYWKLETRGKENEPPKLSGRECLHDRRCPGKRSPDCPMKQFR